MNERLLHNGDKSRKNWLEGRWRCGKVVCWPCEKAWDDHVKLGHTFDHYDMVWKVPVAN